MPLRFLLAVLLVATAASGAPCARADTAEDADFLFRLGLMEGHLMVGHELVQAHQAPPGLPHFGHPIKEIYEDIAPYLKTHKVAPFEKQLIALEAAVTAAPDGADAETK